MISVIYILFSHFTMMKWWIMTGYGILKETLRSSRSQTWTDINLILSSSSYQVVTHIVWHSFHTLTKQPDFRAINPARKPSSWRKRLGAIAKLSWDRAMLWQAHRSEDENPLNHVCSMCIESKLHNQRSVSNLASRGVKIALWYIYTYWYFYIYAYISPF